jgi:hypothetical protein
MNSFKWVKSSYSGGESANCVEIAVLPDGRRAVRDSKNPDGAVFVLTPAQWRELARRVLAIQPRRCAPAGPFRGGVVVHNPAAGLRSAS